MIPLEDKFNDILGKARRGLGLSLGDLARQSGCEESQLQGWEAGHSVPEDSVLTRLAEALRLVPSRLLDSTHKRWYPATPPARMKSFLTITSSFGDMLVNAYLVWDVSTREAALFDTGTDFPAIRGPIESHPLRLKYLFLTHTHVDHVALLDEIRKAWKPEVVTSKGEFVPNATVAAEGRSFDLGRIRIKVFETEGHSPGGLTYAVQNLGERLPQVAVVGDALFAGSVGGPKFSYERLLGNLRKKILTLPDDTILAPGHGPLTTVGEEKKHNPFFS